MSGNNVTRKINLIRYKNLEDYDSVFNKEGIEIIEKFGRLERTKREIDSFFQRDEIKLLVKELTKQIPEETKLSLNEFYNVYWENWESKENIYIHLADLIEKELNLEVIEDEEEDEEESGYQSSESSYNDDDFEEKSESDDESLLDFERKKIEEEIDDEEEDIILPTSSVIPNISAAKFMELIEYVPKIIPKTIFLPKDEETEVNFKTMKNFQPREGYTRFSVKKNFPDKNDKTYTNTIVHFMKNY